MALLKLAWDNGTVSYVNIFFSSRRRHTRSKRDWSSDVCSSDLRSQLRRRRPSQARQARLERRTAACGAPAGHSMNVSQRARIELPEHVPPVFEVYVRSEERRVGKECRSRAPL